MGTDNKKRKIIVATNIAESSLTIPNVTYIIDFCLTKEQKFSSKTDMNRLELVWSSQASCKQRCGRTGRLNDGICFRMVTKYFFEKVLNKWSEAEILRTPLDKVILKIV